MSVAVSLSSTVVAAPGQISCELSGETVILAVDAGTYFGLNSVGCRVWGLIQTPECVGRLCQTLVAEYDVDPATCEREVLELLTQLAQERLIDVRHASIS
jgi:hypothetical protein